MKVLIIGGAGYIGMHACAELLKHDFEVVVADNYVNSSEGYLDKALGQLTDKFVNISRIDAADTAKLAALLNYEGIKAIVYAADLKANDGGSSQASKFYQSNINNILSVLAAMATSATTTKLVYLSSSSVYDVGGTHDAQWLGVAHPLHGKSPYAKAKIIAEQLIRDACEYDPQLSAVILRPFSVAGSDPGQLLGETCLSLNNSPIGALCRLACAGGSHLPAYLGHQTADGTCERDYIHVCDVATAIAASLVIAKNKRGVSTFNVARNVSVSLRELLAEFEAATGHATGLVRTAPQAGDCARKVASPGSIQIPGWKPMYSLNDICKTAWQHHNKIKVKRKG